MWLYILGPIIGGMLGALLYDALWPRPKLRSKRGKSKIEKGQNREHRSAEGR